MLRAFLYPPFINELHTDVKEPASLDQLRLEVHCLVSTMGMMLHSSTNLGLKGCILPKLLLCLSPPMLKNSHPMKWLILSEMATSGRCEEDVIGHIGKVLEILDLVKIVDMDPFQLRMKAFPLSPSKGAKEWWMNEGNGNISTWEKLVKKIFQKFYPLSCASNYDKMCDDDEEEIGKEEGLLNDEVLSDEEWEEQEYENPPKNSFPKPYFEMDKNNHNENNMNTYKSSGMYLSGAPQSKNINNKQPNEGVCRVDKFEVIKYTIEDNEEFLAICTRECDSWERTINGVSSIYHDIFCKKDEGWTVHRTK
ncbi:hypothetical protein Tco_0643495 [Tanacetum coccineum]